MKKLKNEAQLLKEALRVGAIYLEKRKAGKINDADPSKKKIQLIYRLLVHDNLIQPLEKTQENEPNMKRKLALWLSRQLPAGHKLLS
ncbi:MAG: DUF5062 family protein [Endozoicomonas sp. (ex Botrylloides leachii)]|nr:DUF5062 family protein [Endozoicomonas sp. (ex Botrylloides leachii)]